MGELRIEPMTLQLLESRSNLQATLPLIQIQVVSKILWPASISPLFHSSNQAENYIPQRKCYSYMHYQISCYMTHRDVLFSGSDFAFGIAVTGRWLKKCELVNEVKEGKKVLQSCGQELGNNLHSSCFFSSPACYERENWREACDELSRAHPVQEVLLCSVLAVSQTLVRKTSCSKNAGLSSSIQNNERSISQFKVLIFNN